MNFRDFPDDLHDEQRFKLVFSVFLVLCLISYLLFIVLDQPMQTYAAPYGIVSFELAGSMSRVQAIVDSWDDHARLNASFGLGFDFLFIFIYGTTVILALKPAIDRMDGRWSLLGKVIRKGIFLAAGFDVVENIALFLLLKGEEFPILPLLAATCAGLKFFFLATGLIYAVMSWLRHNK